MSSFGWSEKSKKHEMREPATRYLVVSSLDKQVLAFVSWQVDTEDDDIVIYWYLLKTFHPPQYLYSRAELRVAMNCSYRRKYKTSD